MYPTTDRWKDAMLHTHSPIMRVQSLYSVQFGANPSGGRHLDIKPGGSVKFDSTADIKSSLDLTVPGYHYWDVQPWGTELFVERGIDYGDGTQEWVPLGYFRVEKVKQDDAPDGEVRVSAQDRMVRLKEHRTIYPYAYPGGTTHRELFEKLINGFRRDPASAGTTVTYPLYYARTVPITFLGYDPDKAVLPAGIVEDFVYDFLAKIADQRSCVLRFDRIGGLLVDLRERPPTDLPVMTIKPGAAGSLVRVGREVSRAKVYSGVVAYGSDPAYPTGYGFTINGNAAHPLYYRGPFQTKLKKFASPLIHTGNQAIAASRTQLARYDKLPSGTSAVTLPDPSVDIMDSILILHGSAGEGSEIVDKVTIPLDINGDVDLTMRAQNEVSDEGDIGIPDDPGTGGGGAPLFPASFRDLRAYPAVVAGSGTAVNVATSAQLTSALASAVAGQVITLADGTYSGTFVLSKKGTQAQPITVKAANAGKAIFASGSTFTLSSAEWCLISGLAAPYDVAGDVFSMIGACKFCRITRCTFGPATGPVQTQSFRMTYGSCLNATPGTGQAALQRAASLNPQYHYSCGDQHYLTTTPNYAADWAAIFGGPGYAALLPKLTEHWVNVSDHDGYADDAPASAFGSGFQSAYRSYFTALAPRLPATGLYWAKNIGRIQFIQIDERSFKLPKANTDNSSKTMLGATQKQWFKDLVGKNEYPLIVVLGSSQIHVPTEAGDDSWHGYNTERVELQAAIDASTSKFIYLHGNMHALMRTSNKFGYDKCWGAAPIHNTTKVSAAGANIEASYPTNATESDTVINEQFGMIDFTDNGSTITASFKGYTADGVERLSDSLSVTAASAPPTSPSTPAGNFVKITGQSQDCVVDYCEFRNKTRPGNAIAIDGDTAVAGNAGACKHILIAHNHIHDFATEVANGFEAIRFGLSTLSLSESNSAIIRNVFRSIKTEPEIISVKVGKVDVFGNVFEQCVGAICQRHGKAGYVGHNYIIGPATGSAGTKSGGVRLYDADHIIDNNYIASTNGDGFEGAIVVDGGDAGTPALSGHFPVKNAKVRKNVLYLTQSQILVGPNYTVAPDSITVADNIVAGAQGSAGKIIKTPTGASSLSPNTYGADRDAVGLTHDAVSNVERKTGYGPQLTYLRSTDVGPLGDLSELDGSGKAIDGASGAPSTGGGDTPGDPTPPPPTGTPATSIANLLHMGQGAGLNKFNIGIGYTSGHKDHTLAEIENGLSVPGYFELTADKLRCKMSAPLNGGRTSANTKYPRVEFRGLAPSGGTAKQAFNPNASGSSWTFVRSRVTKMPPNKPQLCLVQTHDASDDTAMVYMKDKKTVIAKLGDTVIGTLESNFVFGTDYVFGIKIIGDGSKSKLQWFWGTHTSDLATPKFTSSNETRSTGWYYKAGCYAQSNTDFDSLGDGPFIVEMSALEMWVQGMPAPVGFGTW